MIIGTGIDIVEVDRLAERLSRSSGLREKIFSESEIQYCHDKPKSAEHYAARFAAKEALLKAIGEGLNASFDLHHIVLQNDEKGKPTLVLSGPFAKLAAQQGWKNIHVSLSHTSSFACATVIIEG